MTVHFFLNIQNPPTIIMSQHNTHKSLVVLYSVQYCVLYTVQCTHTWPRPAVGPPAQHWTTCWANWLLHHHHNMLLRTLWLWNSSQLSYHMSYAVYGAHYLVDMWHTMGCWYWLVGCVYNHAWMEGMVWQRPPPADNWGRSSLWPGF